MCCSEKGRAAADGAGKVEEFHGNEMSDTIKSRGRSAGAELQ